MASIRRELVKRKVFETREEVGSPVFSRFEASTACNEVTPTVMLDCTERGSCIQSQVFIDRDSNDCNIIHGNIVV